MKKPPPSATLHDRPLLNSNFQVAFGQGRAHNLSQGFAEVVFPVFRIASAAEGHRQSPAQATDEDPASGSDHRLILKRGFCGSLDLYDWWHQNRNGKTPRPRTLTIQLLAADHDTVVLTWHFHKVRPVALSYSPLRAQEPAVLMETLELSFEGFEMV